MSQVGEMSKAFFLKHGNQANEATMQRVALAVTLNLGLIPDKANVFDCLKHLEARLTFARKVTQKPKHRA